MNICVIILKIKDIDGTMQKLFNFLGLPEHHRASYPKYNNDTGSTLKLSEKTRAELEAFYKPYNEKLQKFLIEELGLDIILPWD